MRLCVTARQQFSGDEPNGLMFKPDEVSGSIASWAGCSKSEGSDLNSCFELSLVGSRSFTFFVLGAGPSGALLSGTLPVWFTLGFVLKERCSCLFSTGHFDLPRPSVKHSELWLKGRFLSYKCCEFSGLMLIAERGVLVLETLHVVYLFIQILNKECIFWNYISYPCTVLPLILLRMKSRFD